MPGPVLELPAVSGTHRLCRQLDTVLAAAPGPGEHTHFWNLCSGEVFQPLETHCRGWKKLSLKALLRQVLDFSEGHLCRLAPPAKVRQRQFWTLPSPEIYLLRDYSAQKYSPPPASTNYYICWKSTFLPGSPHRDPQECSSPGEIKQKRQVSVTPAMPRGCSTI